MFDSVQNTGDFLSPHWLSEVFPNRLKDLHADWAERHAHGKADPWHGLIGAAAPFAKAKGQLTEASNGRAADANRQLHEVLLGAAGYEVSREELRTLRDGLEVVVPLAARYWTATGEALHVLEPTPPAAPRTSSTAKETAGS